MSEPSGDSPNPPPGDPSAASPQKNSVARAPRANPPSVFNPKETPATPPGTPPGFTEFMAWMQSMGGGNVAAEEVPAGRTLIPKEQKKFSRRTTEPASAAAASDVAEASEAGDGTSEASAGGKRGDFAPARSVPLETSNFERKRRSKDGWYSNSALMLTVQLCLFVLVIAAFFLGRATVPKTASASASAAPAAPGTAPDDKDPAPLSPVLQAKMDEAIKAESESDFPHAKVLYEEIQSAGGRVTGLTYHLAELAYLQGEMPRVLPLLNESIAKGEEVAAAYNLRGTFANRTGGVSQGIADLQLAAQLDPFNARYAFFAGEALRRMGKPQAALAQLNQAVYRLRDPVLESYYRLKVRLAQLELGQENEFAAEMSKELAANPPDLDWLLTAAAVELHAGRSVAAVPFLEKARSLVPQDKLDLRLRDYFFYGFRNDKEVARFFTPVDTPAKPVGSGKPVVISTPAGSPAVKASVQSDAPKAP